MFIEVGKISYCFFDILVCFFFNINLCYILISFQGSESAYCRNKKMYYCKNWTVRGKIVNLQVEMCKSPITEKFFPCVIFYFI